MRKLFIFLLITAELLSCKHEDHLKWPKAKGIIVGDGSNGRYSSFLGADSTEYLGKYKAETTLQQCRILL